MKSGTSLVRFLLGQHKTLFSSFETHWFDDSIRFGWENPRSRRMELLIDLYEIDTMEYRAICNIKMKEPEREFIDIVMDYSCRRAGKSRWIEKTPDNIRYWNLIQSRWRHPFFIHVTREYKDVYASWKTRKGLTLEAFLKNALTAYGSVEHMLGTECDNYIEVDYSELVLDPESAMKRILDRIQEPWDSACARIDAVKSCAELEKIRTELGKDSLTAQSLSKPIFTSSLGQWKRLITKREAETIEQGLSKFYEVYAERWN